MLTKIERSEIPQETSLLLVDFNLAEDLKDNRNGAHIASCVSILILELPSLPFYQGTPIFISRAVERGQPVPLELYRIPRVPRSPECYAKFHPDRLKDFPEQAEEIVDPLGQSQDESQDDDKWRHELDHDVESVFWLLLYWAMVAQPQERPEGYVDLYTWTGLLSDFKAREGIVRSFGRLTNLPDNLTHPVYKPLSPLISSLAAILVADRHWIPESSVRKRPEYICEAFQRLILQFIVSNRDKDFMTCRVGETLRQVEEVATPSASPNQQRDVSERYNKNNKRPRLVGRV